VAEIIKGRVVDEKGESYRRNGSCKRNKKAQQQISMGYTINAEIGDVLQFLM
jgi:hypothetical protein